jgi:hypothetical protein
VKIIAGHDVRNAQLVDQVAGYEVFCFHCRQVTVKRDHGTEVCPEGLDQRRLQGRRRKPEQRLFGLEHRARMRFERHNARAHAKLCRLVQRAAQKCLVSLVQPVEIADGNGSAAHVRRDGGVCFKHDHEGRVRQAGVSSREAPICGNDRSHASTSKHAGQVQVTIQVPARRLPP